MSPQDCRLANQEIRSERRGTYAPLSYQLWFQIYDRETCLMSKEGRKGQTEGVELEGNKTGADKSLIGQLRGQSEARYWY